MKNIRYNIYKKFVFIIILFGIVIKLIFDSNNTIRLESLDNYQGLFIDSINSQIEFNTGRVYDNDTLSLYTYKSKYQIVVWKYDSQKTLNNEDVQLLFQKNISNFNFIFYSSIDLGRECSIMKRGTFHNKEIDVLVLKQNTKLIKNTKEVLCFKAKKFALGNDKNKSEFIFDFYDKEIEIEFLIKHFNQRTFVIVLFSLDEIKLAKSILPSIIRE